MLRHRLPALAAPILLLVAYSWPIDAGAVGGPPAGHAVGLGVGEQQVVATISTISIP